MSQKLKYPKISGYQLVQRIGGGGFSTVFRAVHFEDHRVAACKMIALTADTTANERRLLDKEMNVHRELKHKNVLEFISSVTIEPKKKSPYLPGLYMLLELAAGGDLFDKIAPDIGVGDDVAHYYFNQLISGLHYIHTEGVCHRDLKPENLLLDAAGTLKISDFGLSSVYKLKATGETRLLNERCGSLPYVAPELKINKPYAAEPIDIWGCGVILFTFLAGNTPWDEPTKKSEEYCRYLSGQCFNDDPWNRMGENALSLLTGMLAILPSQRMTLGEVFQHPWVTRPSQIAGKGMAVLAQRLTEALRETGDLEIATPDMNQFEVDEDGDTIMKSASLHKSQFTQSLLLFSQTQSGRRYTPHLTRFYSSLRRHDLQPLVTAALTVLGVKWKPPMEETDDDGDGAGVPMLSVRIGGFDKRKLMFKGWVLLEDFNYGEREGTFCVMQRDQGNPISWRLLWKSLIMSPQVEPHVLRKR
ncbi:Serine/threonine-protein kinase CHK1 [Sparassis crispa]|uniref:non-specific serine/threonine protein kinase n=1 Tax=Sparassis crispa TaxID=139825 RepID=A0A401GPJ8_9APHY|nr:Serine/threonine-protein kinase CHK1 [Sparassis crispa]GBE84122.1 Serine/threonine-protein kinase CHK1 [Sparassis crispa]